MWLVWGVLGDVDWSPQILFLEGNGTVYNFQLDTDGKGTWVFVWEDAPLDRIFRMRSVDDGLTWGPPIDFLPQFNGKAIYFPWLATDRDGIWVMTATDSLTHSHYSVSYDNGVTWTNFSEYASSNHQTIAYCNNSIFVAHSSLAQVSYIFTFDIVDSVVIAQKKEIENQRSDYYEASCRNGELALLFSTDNTINITEISFNATVTIHPGYEIGSCNLHRTYHGYYGWMLLCDSPLRVSSSSDGYTWSEFTFLNITDYDFPSLRVAGSEDIDEWIIIWETKNASLMYIYSDDHGTTWSPPTFVSVVGGNAFSKLKWLKNYKGEGMFILIWKTPSNDIYFQRSIHASTFCHCLPNEDCNSFSNTCFCKEDYVKLNGICVPFTHSSQQCNSTDYCYMTGVMVGNLSSIASLDFSLTLIGSLSMDTGKLKIMGVSEIHGDIFLSTSTELVFTTAHDTITTLKILGCANIRGNLSIDLSSNMESEILSNSSYTKTLMQFGPCSSVSFQALSIHSYFSNCIQATPISTPTSYSILFTTSSACQHHEDLLLWQLIVIIVIPIVTVVITLILVGLPSIRKVIFPYQKKAPKVEL
eukprot:TRINITY_DN2697_c0_g1_i2.p1 TRINITY_DN2697_c0_g1~~TRINITY_DN2697_c0_g1_i2.p1  ORF type:complete len:586 (+),score=119.49 TRINITY_DN2697_c0_g1_i2:690-2447(+)